MTNDATRYVVLTIVEPFPLFFAHVDHPEERKRATAKGPFYQAGSRRVELDTPKNYEFLCYQAKGLREAGWTCLVTHETVKP